MRRIAQLTIVLAVLVALLMTSQPSPARAGGIAPFSRQDDPVYLIASYYNAITLRDYARAYAYWNGETIQTLLEFRDFRLFVLFPLC